MSGLGIRRLLAFISTWQFIILYNIIAFCSFLHLVNVGQLRLDNISVTLESLVLMEEIQLALDHQHQIDLISSKNPPEISEQIEIYGFKGYTLNCMSIYLADPEIPKNHTAEW